MGDTPTTMAATVNRAEFSLDAVATANGGGEAIGW
jgi:hypothetical protein